MPKPSYSGGRHKHKRHFNYGPRKNERIRAREVRVIGPDSQQIGILPIDEAVRKAKSVGLDLVEIAAKASPPVCRILDYGKYMYEQSKKERDQKHKHHVQKIKEIKLRVRIEQHDYMTKIRHAEEFLFHGDKVKISLAFRGRENEHKELGFEVVNRAIEDLAHVGHRDNEPKLNGRNITVMVTPHPEKNRKLLLNKHAEEEHPPEEGKGKK